MNTCDILEDAGFRFYEAGTSVEANGLLEQHADNVVLLFSEVEMPGATDGFALARYVAEHWPWIESIISSGRVALNSGNMPAKETFIGKPFNQQMVHDHLREKLPDGKKPEALTQAV